MGSVITSKKGLLKLVKGQINVEVDGSNQPAKDGEQLPKGAVLHIDENATYEITFDDGTKLSNEVAPNDTAAAAPNATDAAALDEIQALQDLIASGEDPTQNLPETAAGNTPGRDGNSGYVTLARSGSEILATSGYSTTGQALTGTTVNDPQLTIAADSPSALANDSNTTDEDTIATGNVLDNDSDVDSSLSVVSFEVGGTTYAAGTEVTLEGGTLVLNADGSYTFTPNDNWNGQVPVITYTTNTGASATLTINISPIDDPSVLANDSNTVDEDTAATGNVLDNDSDVDSTLSVVSFEVGGTTYTAGTEVTLEGGTLILNADGSYTFTPNENWNGQVPVITYTTNTGASATLTINISPVDDASVLVNDSNTVDEDTAATGNVLDNDSDVDSTLSVVSFEVGGTTYVAGTEVTLEGGTLILNADGSYTFTPNENWNGQVPTITYTTNTGSSAILTINITPVADGGPSVTINTDTNNDGFISNEELAGNTEVNVTIGLDGTGANVGDTLTVNGVDYTLTQEDINNGFVNLNLPAPGEGETITVVATITDSAGNTSPEGSDSALLDTTAPTITVDAPDDTQDTTPTITGSTDAPPGSTITIVVTDSTGAEQTLTTTVNPDGTYSVDVTTPLAEGGYTAVATVTDPAGNTGEATDNGNVDNTAPNITVDVPDATNDTTPTITGTTDAPPGSTITIVVTDSTGTEQTLTTTVNPDGTYTVDVTNPVAEGSITATATVTDPAGNTGTATDDGNVDITAPNITVDAPDNTQDTTPTITGSSDATPGSTITIVVTDSTGAEQTLTTTVNEDGTYAVDVTTPLAEGDYTAVATVTDPAGNTGKATDNGNVDTQIDQDGDGNTVAITSITDDTGASGSDFITNDNTLVFNGTVDLGDNSTLAVTINGVVYTTANGLVIDASGNWSIDLTGTTLADGTYPVSATVTDLAGNSKTVTQDVVIDTKIDQDGDGNTVAITSITDDTGASGSDFITNDNTLVFNGTVDLGDNSTLAVTINGVVYTTANGLVIDASGNWSIDLTGTTLADGTYPVSATVTDLAGNSKTVTQDVVIDTKIDQDGDGNTVAITSITDDTGASGSDFITNDNTLIFNGTVDLGDNSTLAVTINGVVYTTANGLVIDASGNWSIDLTGTTLADGTYPVSATVTDLAGNSKTVTQDVVIDTKIDQDGDGNTVAITSITDDTGASGSDFITNDNTLIFNGTVDLGDNSTLAVTINGVVYTTANGLVIDASGNWSIDLTGTTLADGTYPVSATVTDLAGNSKTVTQDVVIDTKIDQDGDGNTVAITSITDDTGASGSDFITNDNTLIFNGTVDLGDNSTLAVTINGVVYTTANGLVIDASGNWSIDLTGTTLADGTYPVSATVTDLAGNSKTVTQDVVIDTKIDQDGDGNTVAITSITDDTGASGSDFITNDNTLVFNGTVDLGDNSTLAVTINGVVYTTANGLVIDASGNWSIDLTGTTLADGTYPVSATVTDLAGNSKTVTQDVVIDTKIDQDGDGNTVAITSITDDTGASGSDFITNDNTLIFNGTVDLGDNSTLAVTINGVVYTTANGLVIDASGNWSIDLTGTTLADGTYPVSATVTDLAGNSKTVTQDVVIDTKIDQDGDGNTVAITSITDDTGASGSDFITNDNTLIFNGTVDLGDNSTLAVTINGVVYTTANGLVIDASGNWSIDLTGTTLADGTYPVSATVTDLAGNSKTVTQDVVIDTKIDQDGDGNTVAITSITDDTGASGSDFITNDNTLVFNGTVDLGDNSTLAVTINGVVYTTANGLVIDASGNWSIDLTGTTLADGTYPVSATVTDLAGNSKTVTQDVVIDTKIDQDGDGNTVAITSITDDTGASGSDFITNDNTLIFNGTVDLGDNSTLAVTINGVVYTTANGLVIDASGNWSIDLTGTTLADGTYPVSATVTDLAGNSKTITQDVVIDTKIDQDGDGNTVAITSITDDTGASGSDFITNDNTLVFNGTVDLGDNSTLAVTINGVVYTTANGLVIDASGNWSIDLTGTTLADGTYPVSATVTDLAGNSKTVTQDVVIDTKIDQDGDGNTVAITSITDDTGASGSDFITNDNTLVFNGTVDLGDNSTLAVTINGVVYTTANGLVIDASGNWSIDLTGTTLADGTYPVSATVTDLAGNSKTVTQDVVIDTKIDQDGDGNTVAITSITDDTGASGSDFITNDNTLVFNGTVDLGDNSTLAVTINGVVYTTANGLVIDASGNWSIDLTGTTLADGTYPVSATVTDLAGNSKTVTQDVVIDTKIDQDGDGNTVAITSITDDTGASGSDFITNDNTLIFNGTVDLGDNSTLAVTINGVVYTTANGLVIDASGNWSIDLTGTTLADGTYPVSATVTDLAGNSKTVTQDVVIDTKIDQDGDGNTVAITSITDDTGASGSDFITNDNTLVFNGTVDLGDNSTLAVTINGVVYTTANGLVIDASGNWSIDLTGTTLADGTYPVSATVTDLAGNSKTVTQDVVIDTKIDQDGDGNTVAITSITDDTGASGSDFITNDNTLIFNGTVDLGDNSTLAVTINGVVYTTANGLVIDASGNWSIDLTGTTLADGTYPVSATVTDLAGNSKTVTQDVVIDTKIDQDGDGNTVAITSITDDTGASGSDFITNDNTLIFNGTVDLGDNSTLAVTINGVVYTTANGLVIDASGNWSIDLTGTTLADGTYPVSATVTDLAGNSKTVTQDVVIDTKIDQDGDGNTVAITSITDDTGASGSDFITNDNTLVFNGTVDLGDNSTLAVTINGVVYTTANGLVIDASGNWSIDLTGTTLADGTYPVSATVTDLAGNSKTVTQDVVIDTKIDQDGDGNTVAITSITDDTGASGSDFITNDNTLIFNGTVDLGDNSTLAVTINGVVYTTANGLVIDASGNWSIDLTGTTLADGTYPVSATVTDLAGNSKTVTQDVVIDTKIDQDGDGNTVAITSITDDTGASGSDFITNDNTLVFNGTVDLGDNSTLAVTINGVVYTTANGLVIDASGNWSIDLTGTTLADGTYPVSATVTDLAGNSKTVTQDVVIDTKIDQDGDGNTVAITSITDDTGASGSDFITNDNTLVFNGTVDLGDNSTLAVTINGVVYTTANGLVIDASGNWSIDLTGTTLADGTYPVSATVTDLAGNSKTVTQDVVIDTKIDQDGDGNTVAITSITDDTGASGSDFITNDNTLVFNGTVDLGDNSTLAVTINGVVYTTANGLVIDASGNWSIDLTGTTLADGTYPVSATVTDLAGNSKTVTQDVVIDTKIDQDGDGNTVAITSITDDTGASGSDFITNDNTLVFNGTVDLGDNSTLAVTINGVVYTTANGLVIDASGNWSIDLTGTTLADGTYPVSATVTDLAGNSKTVTQDVVIDTKIDQDGDGNTVAITSITDDTGASGSDFITNDNTLVFNGTVDLGDNSTLAVTINGVVYTTANGLVIDASGNWSIDLTGTTLADGTYPVSATVTDLAGNSKTVTQDVVIDTKIDQDGDGNTVAITSITDDTGASGSDFITNDNTLVFNGTVDLGDNSTLAVTINGVVYTTANGLVIDASGNWSIDLTGTTLADGTYPVSATVTDLAGNSKTVTQDVVIDTKIDQDGDGNTVAITSITDDTGASGSDFITNDNTLVFNGTVDLGDNSTLAVTINGVVYTTANGLVIDASGNWSIDLTGTTLADGTYPVSATVTDLAGNSKTVTQDVVIDTKIDQDGDGNTVAITSITDDTGASGSDFITNDNTLMFNGTVDLGDNSTLAVTINGVVYTTANGLVIDASGNWSIDLTGTTLADGTYPVSATVTDLAGNSKTVTQDVVIDTKIDQDGDGNTVAITSITDDTGASGSDFITNDNTLIFNGTVDLGDNSTLAVTINGVVYTTANGLVIDASGNWSIDLTGTTLADGTYPVSATVTDLAGNSKTVTQDVVIDTKIDQDGDGNTVAITSITDDTGASGSDFITNDNTLIFNGTVDLGDNSTLAVTINGVVYTTANGLVIDASGNWSIDLTGTTLADGTYPVSATVTDLAGNSKTVTQDVVIDTKIDQDGDGNTVAITSITDDTGASGSDFITNDNTLVFNGTVDLGDNSTLAVTINGVVYTTANGLVIDASGNWSIDLTGTTLADGTYPVSATVTDLAGNSKTVTQDVVIDTKIDQDGDGNTVAITSITDDTGASGSDFITNDNTLVFNGTVDLGDNSTLAVTINGVVYTTANGLVIDASGNWSIDLTGTTLADGTYPVSATVTDLAGNSKTVTQDVVIDTKIDQDGDGNTVAITSITDDTGASGSDFITNDNTLVFNGTVDLGDNSTLAVTINGVVYTTANGLVIDASGNWSIDLTGTTLADGTYPVSATVTDLAGNSKTVTQDVVIDTKIDQDGDGNTVAITSITDDTGASGSDFITNDNTLIFNGTVDLGDNSTLAVTINGVVYTTANGLVIDASGNWSIDLTGTTLADGTYPVSATVTDLAGNSKTVTQDVVIDTKIDQDGDGNTVAITSITDDTGASGSDFITNDNTLVFNGTVDLGDNSTLAVTINGVVYTTANGLVIDASGNWSIDLTGTTLADGTYPVSATVTDLAGNSKTVTQDVVIDTKIDQDGDGNTVAITSITDDTGASGSDFITNDNTLIFNGTVDLGDNSTLAVTINGVVYTTANGLVIDASGNWSIDLTGTTLADGTYPVSATVTDLAGNSKTVTQDVVIDTKIDQDGDGNTVAITSITDDTGASGSDFITNDNTLIFNGTVDLGDNSTLAVTINGVVYTTANGLVIDASGNWSIDLTGTTLADGTYPVSATVTDLAGNSKTVTQDVVIDTKIDQDGDGNTVAITSITDDTGASGSDFITNDNTLIFNGTVDLGDNSTLAVTINGVVYTTANGLVIDASGNWSIDLTGTTLADGTYPVSATVTDLAGNSKTVTQDVVIDTTAPAVSISITEDTNNDGLLSSAELDGQVNYVVTLGAGTALGDTLVIVDQDGSKLFNGPVTQAMLDSGLALAVNAPADGATLTLTATVTDPAGNSYSAHDSVTIDTTAPNPPTVLIVDDGIPGDGVLTQSEISNNGAGVQIEVNIDATDFLAGGHVNLTINNSAVITSIELKIVDVGNGVIELQFADGTPATNFSYSNGIISWTESTPEAGQDITIYATQTDAAGNTSSQGSDTATVNSVPTINVLNNVIVSEEGLPLGLPDSTGDTDSTNSPDASGTVSIQDSNNDNLTVSLSGPSGLFSGGQAIQWSWDPVTQTLTGYIGTAGEASYTEIMTATLTPPVNGSSGNWTYDVTLKGPVDHPDTETEDTLSVNIGINVDDGHGGTSTGSFNVTIEDDAPVISPIAAVQTTTTSIPDSLVGSFSLTGYSGNSNSLDFNGFTISARGFTSSTNSNLIDAAIFGSSSGIGVSSAGAPYHNLANEVDFRKFADGSSASEEIIITLDPGTIAYGVNIQFSHMFGGELEVGVVEFWRDGQLIATQTFSSDASSGDYAANFQALQGGFDTMVIKALDNGQGPSSGDNSDFTVTAIEFLGATTPPAIAFASGTVSPDWGADGKGSLTLQGSDETNLFTATGSAITITQTANTLIGVDAAGHLVFKLEFTPGTGQWDFHQYQEMLQPSDGDIDFKVRATDGDGDHTDGTFSVIPQVYVDTTPPSAPEVRIIDDVNDDAYLTSTEIGSNGVQIQVKINASDFNTGGSVHLEIDNAGNSSTVDLILDNGVLKFSNGALATGYTYTNGVITWTEPTPTAGQAISVTATQTDSANNESAEGTDNATVIDATDDRYTIDEDQQLTGNVLTNDQLGNLSITSFRVMYNGMQTSFNAGQTVTLAVGSLLIQANGEFQFTPNDNWAGEMPSVTYTTNTGSTAALDITVLPIADKPVVNVILTDNGIPLYSNFKTSGITTEQFRTGDFTTAPFNTGTRTIDNTSGQDQLLGTGGNDHLVSANGGGDLLYGMDGDDILVGSDAVQGDSLYGGTGNDVLVAGLGNDGLYGGAGTDIAVLLGNRADYIIEKSTGYSSNDRWFNFFVTENGIGVTKALHDIEYVQFKDGIYAINQITGELTLEQPTAVDYPIEINVSLADRDGSESIDSIQLSGLPEGTLLYSSNGTLMGTADADGNILLNHGSVWNSASLDVNLTGLTLRVPGEYAGQVNLVVEAVSRESGTDLTNTATDADSVILSYFSGHEGEPGDQNLNFGNEHNIVVGDLDGSVILPGQNYNIAFMVDSSGSIGSTALNSMTAQLEQVFTTLKNSATAEGSGTVNVFLVDFDGISKGWVSVDMKDPNALSILEDALDDMRSGGNTNYEDVFKTTANWFSGISGNSATNLAYFITDGQANEYNYNEGQNPEVYNPRGANNSIYLSSIIQNGYVFGNIYSQDGRTIINQYGEVLKWTQNSNNSWSSSSVGFMRPDGNGGFQFANLGTNGTGTNANSQQGFAFLSTLGVIVQAIGIGPSLDSEDLKPFDSDGNVLTNINAEDLADAIIGTPITQLPGSDTINGGNGDDILFGDAINFNGISGQGYVAIKDYVADQLGIAAVTDAQVHRYITEHASDFDQSGASDKADVLIGGQGNDILYGQGGNDQLYGGNGNDLIFGGAGNDTIIGGLGNDKLTGGTGADTFVWQAGESGTDHITDFNIHEDKLDLRDLLQGENTNTLDSYLNFSLNSSGSTVIDIDANQDGVFEQHIILDGVNLFDEYGSTNDAGIINGLLGSNNDGPLIIDSQPVTPEPVQGIAPLDTNPHHNIIP
ncbi:Ig-like domain-containing protein [Shewanella baltica]|uniref:Ig-like domain-containing protein n=3 Tax=Shewanella baltica TaxID=62322 RepID=UPI0002DCEA29|nr:Ig-like domain-containing protein [Shewanella baltica]